MCDKKETKVMKLPSFLFYPVLTGSKTLVLIKGSLSYFAHSLTCSTLIRGAGWPFKVDSPIVISIIGT